jgi:GT2 family glycosyltransferase
VSGPEVSVVVPTRSRETRLAFLLDALAEQTLDRDRYEVIVVRADDSLDGPHTEPPDGFEVRFLSAPRGTSSQRNAGWRAARAPLVAFTDDDCRPAPEWLERVLAAAGDPDVFIQGRTEPDPDERGPLRGLARTMDVDALDVWAPTCNMTYPRELLERVGGFDERFVEPWGEDTDLAWRVREAGGRQEFRDDVLVWHAVHSRTLPEAIRDGTTRNAIPMVVARHPALRDALVFRLFLLESHAWLAVGLAGVAVAGRGRRWIGLAAFAPYVRHHLEDAGVSPAGVLRWSLLSAPRAILVHGAEMAANAVSSARHRSLVL